MYLPNRFWEEIPPDVRSNSGAVSRCHGASHMPRPWCGAALAGAGFLLALLVTGCLGGDSAPGSTAPEGGDDPAREGVLLASSGEDGIASVTDADGQTLFEVELLDAGGSPLSGVQVTCLASSRNPLICLNDSASGDPYGMFELVPGLISLSSAQSASGTAGVAAVADAPGHEVGVLILELLDPSYGHIYDPARDLAAPSRTSTLQAINRVVDFEDLVLFIETTPGITLRAESRIASMRSQGDFYGRFFDAYGDDPSDPERYALAQRMGCLASFSAGQHDSYRYRSYEYEHDDDCHENDNCMRFAIPLGVQATITFDSPIDGVTFTDPEERLQELQGAINLPPNVLTLDGGHVELCANGVLLADALGISGDGTGDGALFSTGELQLAEGENTLQIVAYVSHINRGFENGINGEAGQATVTVYYEPAESAPTAPLLGNVSYPTSFSCPDGVVPILFHFTDPDGDVMTVYERIVWNFGGEAGDASGSAPVEDLPHLACLTGTQGDCQINLSYHGLAAGDWFQWEFWVEDATGLQSNHLELQVTITGCAPVVRQAAWAIAAGVIEAAGR